MKNAALDEIEFKLNCVKVTMELEDMILPNETVNLYRKVLTGECSADTARKKILKEHLGI